MQTKRVRMMDRTQLPKKKPNAKLRPLPRLKPRNDWQPSKRPSVRKKEMLTREERMRRDSEFSKKKRSAWLVKMTRWNACTLSKLMQCANRKKWSSKFRPNSL